MAATPRDTVSSRDLVPANKGAQRRGKPPPTPKQAARKGLRGPSTDPATNLLLADVALRGVALIARIAIEHALLANRYDRSTAKAVVARRGIGKRLLSAGLSRMAARSLPGAVLVSGGMAGKVLFDRARARRQARIANGTAAARPPRRPAGS